MSTIQKVEFTYRKPELRYDRERRVWVGYRVDVRAGRKRHRPVFRTREKAEQFIVELLSQKVYRDAGLKYASRADVVLSQLLERRLKQIKNPKEVVRAKRIFEMFAATFDTDPLVTLIRKANFQTYINERMETGVKKATVDREITILSTAFKQASVLFPDELEDFEGPAIARPGYRKRKTQNRHVISDEEKDAVIVSILTQRLKREQPVRTRNRQVTAWIFEMGWLMGFRFSEVLGIAKTDYAPKFDTLRVRRGKTDDVSIIKYLPDRVKEILEMAARHSKSERIFDLTCSEHTFTDMIGEAFRANNITYGRDVADGSTFHSTRHSFTSRLVQVTDIATAQEFTAHSSGTMVNYYSHPTEESKRLAMERMYGKGRARSLTAIYEKVRSGEMSLEEFLASVK